MQRIKTLLIVLLAVATGMLASCGGPSGPAQSDPVDAPDELVSPSRLPGLSELDSLHAAAAVRDHEIPVTEPIAQRHTQVAGESLEFIPPPDELAFALYRADPPGPPLTLSATGAGPLWLLVADYGAGKWKMEPFVDGNAEIDLSLISGLYSPDGYMYSAVICPAGESGRLDSMTLSYDEFEWELTISADDESITLNWNEMDADSYAVYRSTLADDEAPYHVATVIEEHTGGNSFTETVPADDLGRWVPENNDNGTTEDSTDDFPTIAPEVDYYYRLAPVVDGHRYAPSPEVSARVGWGTRWGGQRDWPDTTAQTRMIGRALKPRYMTDAQVQWIAENMAGLIEITQDEADMIRAYNPDFIVLGEHWSCFVAPDRHGYFGSDVQGSECFNELVYGNEVDLDNIYPYVDRHEDWFIHHDESYYEHNRVFSEPNGYWLDVDGTYMHYLAADVRQLLGEYHFDAISLADYSPYAEWASNQFWPGEYLHEDFAEYWRPKALRMLTQVTSAASEHPRRPAIFAHTWDLCYWDTGEMDFGPCDGIVVEEFTASWYNPWHPRGRTETVINRALAEQRAGKALILNSNLPGSFDQEVMSVLACYLLVRGPRTYLNYPGTSEKTDGVKGTAPIWYPACGVETGAPLDPLAETMDDYLTADEFGTPYYRRDFEECSAIVVSSRISFDNAAYTIDILRFDDGGVVDDDGNLPGSWEWVSWHVPRIEFYMAGYVVRGLPED